MNILATVTKYLQKYHNKKQLFLVMVSAVIIYCGFNSGFSYSENEKTIEVDHDDATFYQLWPDDPLCSHYQTRFGTNISLTYLASYPRSGNTWTRYLLEGATGIFTGSVYKKNILDKYFLGEKEDPKDGRTIVVKIHPLIFNDPVESLEKTPVIFILRNPFNSISSYWEFRLGRKIEADTKQPIDVLHFRTNQTSYQSKAFHQFVEEQIFYWEDCASEIITETKRLHVVFYEELVEDPIRELKKILQFLNISPDYGRLQCTQKHNEGIAKRKSTLNIDPYEYQERKNITKSLAKVIGLLNLRGIEVPKEYKDIVRQTLYVLG